MGVLLLGAASRDLKHVQTVFATAGIRVFVSREVIDGANPDAIVILDSEEYPCNWQQTAGRVFFAYPATPVVLVSSRNSASNAIAAMRMGIRDYILLPLDAGKVIETLRNCTSADGNRSLWPTGFSATTRETMVGQSHVLTAVRAQMLRVAAADCTVLITGETGTGKELAAEFIHGNSARRRSPLVCVNCAALPDSLIESELFGHVCGAFTGATENREGLIASADGGIVLLDEIGDMGLQAQAKILRAIEKKEVTAVGGTRGRRVDVRFIAATNQDLAAMARLGTFRKDLYYRLNVASVSMPPLRDRREDIPLLVEHYRRRLGHDMIRAISEDCMERLIAYDWPGNIRELRNVLESIFLACEGGVAKSRDLPAELRTLQKGGDMLCDSERERLVEALCSSEWNKSRAAERLHWSRMTLYRKMAKYRIVRVSSPQT
jgi:DNA-binding NtrC family response regulator